jgi:hypothetical protein
MLKKWMHSIGTCLALIMAAGLLAGCSGRQVAADDGPLSEQEAMAIMAKSKSNKPPKPMKVRSLPPIPIDPAFMQASSDDAGVMRAGYSDE